jgi:hypothetical protein
MNAIATSLAGLAAIGFAATQFDSGGPRASGAADLVTKTYDLTSASPVLHNSEYTEALAPTLTFDNGDATPSLDASQTHDSIANELLELFGAEFEYEGRSLQVDEHGRAQVVAPAAVHKEIERVLAFLETAFRRGVELRVDMIERPGTAPALPALMSVDEAEKLVAGSGASAHGTTLRIAPARIATLDLTHSVDYVADYDVEIAQATAQAYPVVRSYPIGVRMAARAAIVPGGTRVALLLRDSVQNGALRATDVQLGASVSSDSGQHFARGSVTVQSLSLLEHSFALNLFVPDGQAVVIDSTLSTQSGASRIAFVVRSTTTAREPVMTLQISAGHSPLEVFDASFVCPPRVDVDGRAFDQGVFPRSLDGLFDCGSNNYEGNPAVQGVLRMGDQGWIENVLGGDGEHQVQGLSSWLLIHPSRQSEPGKSAKSALGADSPVLAQARTGDVANVSLTLRRADKNGAVLAALTWPIVYGEASAAVIGGETQYIGGANVEVAQSAATIDPVVHTAFDGLVVRVRPTRATDGTATVELSARGHVLGGPMQDLEAGAPMSLPIKRCEFDNLSVDERLSFGAPAGGQPGPRRISLGGGTGLVLDFELR